MPILLIICLPPFWEEKKNDIICHKGEDNGLDNTHLGEMETNKHNRKGQKGK